MCRAISLVENSSHEHTRTEIPNALQLDQEEKIVGLALLTVASTVFQQCSAAIYDVCVLLCSYCQERFVSFSQKNSQTGINFVLILQF